MHSEKLAAEYLRKSAQLMEERGKCTGRLRDSDGRVCILGGAHLAALKDKNYTTANHIISIVDHHFSTWMDAHYPEDTGSPVLCAASWNDRVLDSKEETIAWMNKCADDLEASSGSN